MLRVQMQVQVLPVATAITLVCRYVVKYQGECFGFALCLDGKYLRYQKREEQGTKRAVVVMLRVSTCVNEIHGFREHY
jgi:hypothetical protein